MHRLFLRFVPVFFCLVVSETRVRAEPSAEEIARLDAFFEESFQGYVDRHPLYQTMLGGKKDYDKWNDLSDAAATRELAIRVEELARLRSEFDPALLDASSRLSHRLFEHEVEAEIAAHAWRRHGYPVSQMHGYQSMIPSALINYHRVDDASDAAAYIARLHGVGPLFDQLLERLETNADLGVIPPKFVFPKVLGDCRNILTGAPFDDSGADSTLLADFEKKIDGVDGLSDLERRAFVAEAKHALVASVRPAYRALMATLEALEQRATDDDGVWKLPRGAAYYGHRLRMMTTTDLTAEEIHEIGLREMERIHDEMRAIMRQVGFQGTLQDFFVFMKEDDRFYYPETDEGRARYLTEATRIIDAIREDLDRMFLTQPKAGMVVKRVEAFREKSAGKAFYNRGTPDGSRPGIYYANLYRMREMPIYQMEALAFHEGIPGHHMQISIAQELQGVPRFRKFGGNTAYIEGWALYCELLPKEFGYYRDPYSDFGRLAMELWRAARLVVDTGIHHYRWTRDKAIRYLTDNTPNPEGDCVKAIERYTVMPGQATAYKIGMLKILELRARAEKALGDRFDLRAFHDVILANGATPLDVLEDLVDDWTLSVTR